MEVGLESFLSTMWRLRFTVGTLSMHEHLHLRLTKNSLEVKKCSKTISSTNTWFLSAQLLWFYPFRISIIPSPCLLLNPSRSSTAWWWVHGTSFFPAVWKAICSSHLVLWLFCPRLRSFSGNCDRQRSPGCHHEECEKLLRPWQDVSQPSVTFKQHPVLFPLILFQDCN